MRKIIACFALLALLTGFAAAIGAASAADNAVQTYANVPFGYSIDYPLGWILLDKDTIDFYLAQLSGQDTTSQGISASALETVRSLLADKPVGSYIEWIDLNGNTFTVTCFGFPTPADFESMLTALAPQLVSTYKTMFTEITLLDGGSLYTAGDKEFLKLKFQTVLYGQAFTMTILYYFENNMVYTFNAAWLVADEKDLQTLDALLDVMMASFALE